MSPVSVRSLLYKDYIWSRIDWPWTCFMTMVLSGDLGSQMKLVTITGGDVCLRWVLWACPPAKRALLALVSPQYPISPSPVELLFSSCSSAFLESWAKQGWELGSQDMQDLMPQDIPRAHYWASSPAEDYGQHTEAGHSPAGFSFSNRFLTPLGRSQQGDFSQSCLSQIVHLFTSSYPNLPLHLNQDHLFFYFRHAPDDPCWIQRWFLLHLSCPTGWRHSSCWAW